MKRIIFALIFLICTTAGMAQTIADYDAVVGKFQRFYNQQKVDSVFNMFSERMQSMLPLGKTAEMLNDLSGKLGDMKNYKYSRQEAGFRYYKTEFAHATLTLIAALGKDNKLETFRLVPYQEDTAVAKKEKSNFVLKTKGGNIYGTLSAPDMSKRMPVVLIIAGSGPTDRNGNSPLGVSSDAYKMIADSLRNDGIACARYDKRGVAESATAVRDEEDITFNDLVNDAAGFIKMLKEDHRFSKVIVLGHSEGSLIGMLAAQKEKVSAYISVSGVAVRADKIIEKQIATQSKKLAQKATIILDSLDKGYIVKDIDPSLTSLFRPSVQQYMISWLKYEPAQEIKKIKIPVLIIQGTTDLQVGVEQANQLKKSCPHASLKLIPGMNHILKEAPEDRKQNMETYTNPSLPLSPGLMPDIVSFIKSVK